MIVDSMLIKEISNMLVKTIDCVNKIAFNLNGKNIAAKYHLIETEKGTSNEFL